MDKELKILQVSPEVGPFARTGGLADVVWALSKELKALGHDVRVAMPRYNLPGQQEAFESLGELGPLHDVPLGDSVEKISIYEGQAKESKDIPVYLIHHEGYLYRDKLYGYQDDPERFILFCRGVLEMLNLVDWRPDAIHCHDWPTGLVPGYIRLVPEYKKVSGNVATVYTIHNMQYQGVFPLDVFDLAGLGEQKKPLTAYWHYDNFCFKKGALIFADLITTVSKTYAQEIQETELGYGLEGVLKSRGEFLHGVVNGIDYESWNPEHDQDIERYYGEGYFDGRIGKNRESRIEKFEETRFSDADLDGKPLLRKELETVCGWEHDPGAMIIGRIGRISAQKDRILLKRDDAQGENALETILKDKEFRVRFVILGRAAPGDEEGQTYRDEFEKFHKSYRKKLCFLNVAYPDKTWPKNKEADISLEHLIYGGADAFLVPSLFEPCGLVQQQAHRYGTVPIVRATGGLVDTVTPHDDASGKGDGFFFKQPSGEAVIQAIREAFKVYGDRTAWRTLMLNGMQRNHHWRASAEQYEELYRRAMQASHLSPQHHGRAVEPAETMRPWIEGYF